MMRIMLVEDDAPLRDALATSLSAHGYEITEAGSAEEAVVLAGFDVPDLVLLDVVMPRTDTSKLARELRARIGRETPIVFLTALPKDEKLLAEVGARDWIEKPFDVLKFADVVEQHLRC